MELERARTEYMAHLAIERGASANTIVSYGHDLTRYVRFLSERNVVRIEEVKRSDVEAFVAQRDRLADYYSTIEYLEGKKVDGVKVSAEAAADLVGMQVVLETAKSKADFNYEDFFNMNAMLWAQVNPEGTALMLAGDTHPLNYLRTNVNVQMMQEFYDTYGAKEGDTMYLAPESRIIMWGPEAK